MRSRPIVVALAAAGALATAIAIDARLGAQQPSAVNFTRDVAPIVYDHCAMCHRVGEEAPFPLVTYQDVKTHAKQMVAATSAHRMPPWKAAPADFPYQNERRLSDADISALKRWVDAGMPEGDPSALPPMPHFHETWPLGPPDLVVKMDRPFPVPAAGRDIYRNFVVPLGLDRDAWVSAIDFRPSSHGVVHHSLFLLDTTGNARRRDGRDGLPGYNGAMGLGGLSDLAGGRAALGFLLGGGRGVAQPARPPDDGAQPAPRPQAAIDTDAVGRRIGGVGGLGGWAMGAQPHVLPDGLAFFVPKGADLILSTHFHPSGRAEEETSTVALYFAAGPPTRKFTGIQLPPLFGVFEGIDIPAGEKHYTISDSFVLPVDVKAFLVGAHAHYLGKEMKLTATFPDGSTKTLLDIPDWDLAWQEQYQFQDFVMLPKGTRLEGTVTYDNSADNPRNPSKPPVRVTWGEQSTDEMGSVGVQVVAADDGDLPILQRAYRQHVAQALQTRPGLRMLLERFRSQQSR
jgi:hypothetical protein